MHRDELNGKAEAYPRAYRFPIHMTLRYRTPGETGWLVGEMENISRSGVLFHGSAALDANTPIEFRFALPVEIGGEPGALVLSQGCVVRTILPAATDASPAMAAKFSKYRLVRESEVATD